MWLELCWAWLLLYAFTVFVLFYHGFCLKLFLFLPLKWTLLFLSQGTQKQLLLQHLTHISSCCFYSSSMKCKEVLTCGESRFIITWKLIEFKLLPLIPVPIWAQLVLFWATVLCKSSDLPKVTQLIRSSNWCWEVSLDFSTSKVYILHSSSKVDCFLY